MSTTLHETPTRPSPPQPPRRRPFALLAAATVLAAALGAGTALALGGRGTDPTAATVQPTDPTRATAAAVQQAAPSQSAQPAGQPARPAATAPTGDDNASGQQPGSDDGATPGPGAGQPSGRLHREGVVILADGRYDAYVRKVDPDRDLIVVDLVQVFTGDAAVEAAIEDGMDRDAAKVRDTYVRNQNDRLRTLEMAGDVRVNLLGACESTGREDLFSQLIADARYGDLFYYTLRVQDGLVQRIDEHQAQPAC
jgi:hypothetical protein